MARPKNKVDLIQQSNDQFHQLLSLIDSMSESEQMAPFQLESAKRKEVHWKRDKNVRDVLIHLYEWHQLLIHWMVQNQQGIPTSFLPSPYNWKNYGEMNHVFWENHQHTPLEKAMADVQTSHEEVMSLITSLSDEDLFTKKRFDWTGSTSLGSYCISSTSSHYDWAIKKIKIHKKNCQATA